MRGGARVLAWRRRGGEGLELLAFSFLLPSSPPPPPCRARRGLFRPYKVTFGGSRGALGPGVSGGAGGRQWQRARERGRERRESADADARPPSPRFAPRRPPPSLAPSFPPLRRALASPERRPRQPTTPARAWEGPRLSQPERNEEAGVASASPRPRRPLPASQEKKKKDRGDAIRTGALLLTLSE